MAKKRNNESTSTLTLGTTEDTQIINSADLEAQEAELLNDIEKGSEEKKAEEKEEAPISEVSDLKETAIQPKKPRKQRHSRKATPVEITTSEAIAPTLDLSKEVTMVKETVEMTMNTMVAQFTAIKELTTGMNAQLEKMNTLIQEMSPTQSSNLEEWVKPQVQSQFITKFATAASLAAMLLSILSMSMAQSARQTILSASFKNNESLSIQANDSKETSNELALANKDTSNKKNSFTSNSKSLIPFKSKK